MLVTVAHIAATAHRQESTNSSIMGVDLKEAAGVRIT
jgi:hypothetical protein